MLGRGAGVHEGLSHDGQTGVRDAALVDVKHKLRVLDHVHPETQREAAGGGQRESVRDGQKCDERRTLHHGVQSSYQLLFHV